MIAPTPTLDRLQIPSSQDGRGGALELSETAVSFFQDSSQSFEKLARKRALEQNTERFQRPTKFQLRSSGPSKFSTRWSTDPVGGANSKEAPKLQIHQRAVSRFQFSRTSAGCSAILPTRSYFSSQIPNSIFQSLETAVTFHYPPKIQIPERPSYSCKVGLTITGRRFYEKSRRCTECSRVNEYTRAVGVASARSYTAKC